MKEQINKLLREALNVNSNHMLNDKISLINLGLNSVSIIYFVTLLEDAFDIEIPNEALYNFQNNTLYDINSLIKKLSRSESEQNSINH
ncbi:acyl carrier protein [Streptococcus uberis]|uniref:acyl carrier protein n=1 Tax=Streptococcus uberis TaxID=1349 RepID=UPI003D3664BA